MRHSLAVVCAVVGLALPGMVFAKPKVALTAIDGDRTGQVGSAVSEALENDLTMIAPKAVDKAFNRSGYDFDMTDQQAKKLAAQLEADAVIGGKLATDGSLKAIRFKVYVPGKKVKRFTVKFKTVRGLRAEDNQERLRETFIAKITGKPVKPAVADDEEDGEDEEEEEDEEEAPPPKKKQKQAVSTDDEEDPLAADAKKSKAKKAKVEEQPVAEAEPKSKAKKAKAEEEPAAEEEQKTKATKKAAKSDEEEADRESKPEPKQESAQSEDKQPAATQNEPKKEAKKETKKVAAVTEDGDEVAVTKSAKRSERSRGPEPLPALRVNLGAGAAIRSLTFKQTASMNQVAPVAPFKTNPLPGAHVELEFYPLALSDSSSPLAPLGLVGEFDRTLSVPVSTGGEMSKSLTGTQQHWSAGLRYRFAIGSHLFTVGASFGQRTFTADRASLTDAEKKAFTLPDTNYTVIDPGVGYRMPLGRLSVVADVRGMLIPDAGPIQENNSYGQAKLWGLQGRGGVEVGLGRMFGFRVVAEYVRVTFNFTGTGDLARARDMDPTTIEIKSAADVSYGAIGTFVVKL